MSIRIILIGTMLLLSSATADARCAPQCIGCRTGPFHEWRLVGPLGDQRAMCEAFFPGRCGRHIR